jgi:hypothetical protein
MPIGWTAGAVTVAANQSSIQFYTTQAIYALAPGSSYSFTYASMDSPATEFGNSPAFPSTPVGTSVAYQGGFLTSPSSTFVITQAPEPSSIALLAAAGLGLLVAVRRRKLARAAQV